MVPTAHRERHRVGSPDAQLFAFERRAVERDQARERTGAEVDGQDIVTCDEAGDAVVEDVGARDVIGQQSGGRDAGRREIPRRQHEGTVIDERLEEVEAEE